MEKTPYQHGLQRQITGQLQSLWLETPGYCNLACRYCFACGGEPLRESELLTFKEIETVLHQAQQMGADSFGIPGAGEPLLKKNLQLTMRIIRLSASLGFYTALFTTGEFITEKLADELRELPVEILLKCNSLNVALQDRFVSNPFQGRIIKGYGKKRNMAIKLLLRKGFADEAECQSRFGRQSRLALVTSIMTDENGTLSNLDQVVAILRYCRRKNIIFDCDSVLTRGRGITCGLCTADQQLKDKLLELQQIDQQEFDRTWEITQSYIGGPACDRYAHHLYITQYGEILPCIGATGVHLGNVRTTTLQEAWDSPEMKIIRARRYGGKCGNECANFAEGRCNSCLGRRAINLTNKFLIHNGYVDTISCWNFREKSEK